MSESLTVQPAQSTALTPVTPMDLIQMAQAKGDVQMMAQLFELKLRVEADEARKAFNSAMAVFKRNPPRITKNVQKKAGSMDLNYASIDHVCAVLIPALAAVGIRHSWGMKQDDGKMAVTCTLTHEMGHSEGTTMSAPYDNSGGKNNIQAIASAETYLQRYTLLAATGQAAGGTDDDAVSAVPRQQMPDAEFIHYRDIIQAARNQNELQAAYKDAKAAAAEHGDTQAPKDFHAITQERLRALKAGAQ